MSFTVLQFGEGNFIRAFFDWMLQIMKEDTDVSHEVFLVQPISQGRVKSILNAGGVYHVLLRGYENGQYIEKLYKIDVIKDGVNPFEDFEKLLEAGISKDLKVVVSNTTEAGISYKKMDKPANYPSMLAKILYERCLRDLPPLYILPLELVENNGERLKECIIKYANDWNYPAEFFDYLDACNFYNTLVDRIVSGFPSDVAERVFEEIGGKDENLTSGELFHLFVIQGDESILNILPFDKAGLNVILTDNLTFYRNRKVRILNGSHTAIAPIGLLNGIEYVRDYVEHPYYGERLYQMVHDEIVPAFSDSTEEHRYADEVFERFKNPALKHKLRAIALNSISKINERLRPTIEDYYRKFGRLPERMMESVAAMVELYDCDGVKILPGGPLKLSDHDQVIGRTSQEMIETFFPNLEEKLRGEIVHAVERLREAWKK